MEEVMLNSFRNKKFVTLYSLVVCSIFWSSQNIADSKISSGSIKIADVAVGGQGTVFILTPEQTIWKFKSGDPTWTKISGLASQIAVDSRDLPWVVNSNNTLYRGDGKGTWKAMPGCTKKIALGANGGMWRLGCKQKSEKSTGWEITVWAKDKRNNYTWINRPGGAINIAVDSKGDAITVDKYGKVNKYAAHDYNYFSNIKAPFAVDIISDSDQTYIISNQKEHLGLPGHTILKQNKSGQFKKIMATGQAMRIVAHPKDNNPWILNRDGTMSRFYSGSWHPQQGPTDRTYKKQCVYSAFGIGYVPSVDWYYPHQVTGDENGRLSFSGNPVKHHTPALGTSSCVHANVRMFAEVSVIGHEAATVATSVGVALVVAAGTVATGGLLLGGGTAAAAIGGAILTPGVIQAALETGYGVTHFLLPKDSGIFYIGAPHEVNLNGTVWNPSAEEKGTPWNLTSHAVVKLR